VAATIPTPAEPGPFETAIEFPYALFLAPTVYASGLALDGFSTGFTSRSAPLVSPPTATAPDGVVDLWTTTLVGGRRGIDPLEITAPFVPQVSAVWALDYFLPAVSSTYIPPPPDVTPEHYIEYDYQPAPK
jgi:hypothetical protein